MNKQSNLNYYERPYHFFAYHKLKDNCFLPGINKNGELVELCEYGGDYNSFGSLEEPKVLNRSDLLEYKGKYHISTIHDHGGILGIIHITFAPLNLGEDLNRASEAKSHCSLDGTIMSIDYKNEFIAVAYPTVDEIRKELRSIYAYGGYFSYEYEANGGYISFLDSYKDLANKNRYRNIPDYEIYESNFHVAYNKEMTRKDLLTKEDVKLSLQIEIFTTTETKQLEFNLI